MGGLADFMFSVTGTLKGYDALMNLVLDDVQEVLRGEPFLPFTSVKPINSHLPIFQMTKVTNPHDPLVWW